jgi:sulfite exporter TauE/SafE
MSELALIALGGVLGSTHCLGMCGAFALSVGLGARGPAANLARQLVYSAGRIFTYAFLGAAAGFAGFWLAHISNQLIHAQAILSILAGMLLMVQGCHGLGVIPGRLGRPLPGQSGAGATCLAGSFVRPFLASPRGYHVFIAGMLNGLLPCGLVYGYLALASSSASLPYGVIAMACFGAGTVPLMVLTGLSASTLTLAARRGLFRVAGVCVLVTGLGAVVRGVEFYHSGDGSVCPGCDHTHGAAPSDQTGGRWTDQSAAIRPAAMRWSRMMSVPTP